MHNKLNQRLIKTKISVNGEVFAFELYFGNTETYD